MSAEISTEPTCTCENGTCQQHGRADTASDLYWSRVAEMSLTGRA